MDSKKKVSIIIPAHNGSGCITRTVESLLEQDYGNKEIIIVENGSIDNTWGIVRDIANKHPKELAVFKNKKGGTTFARHRGIKEASGDYIVFVDQDDCLISRNAISSMVEAANQTKAQIVQFGYYVSALGIKRRNRCTEKEVIISRNNLLLNRLGEVIGYSESGLSSSVWAKIYEATILKEIADKIELPLICCEDMYLNLLAFTTPSLNHVALIPKEYYVFHLGIGTSGGLGFNEKLFYEYNQLKPFAVKHVIENGGSDAVIHAIHLETIYFFRAIVGEMIYKKKPTAEIVSKINEYDGLEFVQSAKAWFAEKEDIDAETSFLVENYTAEEYYEHVRDTYRVGIMNVAKRNVRRLARRLLFK